MGVCWGVEMNAFEPSLPYLLPQLWTLFTLSCYELVYIFPLMPM
jgi:hypothetical protein